MPPILSTSRGGSTPSRFHHPAILRPILNPGTVLRSPSHPMARCPHGSPTATALEMGRAPPLPGVPPSTLHVWPLKKNQCQLLSDRSSGLLGRGFALRGQAQRRFRFVVCAENWSEFSPGVGFDLQVSWRTRVVDSSGERVRRWSICPRALRIFLVSFLRSLFSAHSMRNRSDCFES